MEGKTPFNVSEPPKGWRRLLFLGPGLVWSASAVGVGSLVFATRAGAIYGLALLWAPILTIFIKFFMTELIGRYTVITGENAVFCFWPDQSENRSPATAGWLDPLDILALFYCQCCRHERNCFNSR